MPGLVLLIFMLVFACLVLAFGWAWLTARMILRPPRMSDGKALYILRRLTPMELLLPFENVSFLVHDEREHKTLRIAAWWIPAPLTSERCVVFLHGYADAKVGSIAWAPLWHELGWNVLAIDLRAHGESGGKLSTGGFFERHDVEQVIHQLRVQRPEQTKQVALFGVSLGAAVALAAASLESVRDEISAVVVECPFVSYRDAVATHVGRLGGVPVLQPLASKIAQWLSAANFDAVRPIDLIAKVSAPVLMIQSGRDVFVGSEGNDLMKQALLARAPKNRVYRCDNAEHLRALPHDPPAYRAALDEFLSGR